MGVSAIHQTPLFRSLTFLRPTLLHRIGNPLTAFRAEPTTLLCILAALWPTMPNKTGTREQLDNGVYLMLTPEQYAKLKTEVRKTHQ